MSAALTPTALIKARAIELGFDLAGVARIEPLAAHAHYQAWLDAGRHGEMAYLATDRNRERRADPERILPGLCSVVCLALCYDRALDPEAARRRGRIARYAGGEDYHRVVDEALRALEGFVAEVLPGAKALGYVDTGAILERGWAERAGLGWIGKHSGLISPQIGSWLLLAELLVDHDLDPDPPIARDHCGTCTRCLSACPTGAIVAPRQVDARLCISYLTIELRGAIPIELRPLVGDWIFGCDVCQEVCPWNRFAPPARAARLHARSLEGWTLERFLELDDEAFRTLFADSPIRRARRAGFLRNVCVALGNRGDADAAPALMRALAGDPEVLVRQHAAWALGEIGRAVSGAGTAGPSAEGVENSRAIADALERAARNDSVEVVAAEARNARRRIES